VPTNKHEASGRHGAALLYDWRHARLEVVFSDGASFLHTFLACLLLFYVRTCACSIRANLFGGHLGITQARQHC